MSTKLAKETLINTLLQGYTKAVVSGHEYITLQTEVIAEVLTHLTQENPQVKLPLDDEAIAKIEAYWRLREDKI